MKKLRKRVRRLVHVHNDPNYQLIGVNDYYTCRCGALRVRRAYSNLYGPVPDGLGWPKLVDKHGFPRNDTGWCGRS